MDAELEEQRRRAIDAKARLAGYQPRLGETFPLQGELDDRLAQLAEIEADLASTEGTGATRPSGTADGDRRLNGIGFWAGPFPARSPTLRPTFPVIATQREAGAKMG